MAYAWQGLMENEFMRGSMTCDTANIVPRNADGSMTQYSDTLGPNQACTVSGSTPGSDIITGDAYMEAAFGIYHADLWRRCFLVLLGAVLLFQLTQILVLEYFPVRDLAVVRPNANSLLKLWNR